MSVFHPPQNPPSPAQACPLPSVSRDKLKGRNSNCDLSSAQFSPLLHSPHYLVSFGSSSCGPGDQWRIKGQAVVTCRSHVLYFCFRLCLCHLASLETLLHFWNIPRHGGAHSLWPSASLQIPSVVASTPLTKAPCLVKQFSWPLPVSSAHTRSTWFPKLEAAAAVCSVPSPSHTSACWARWAWGLGPGWWPLIESCVMLLVSELKMYGPFPYLPWLWGLIQGQNTDVMLISQYGIWMPRCDLVFTCGCKPQNYRNHQSELWKNLITWN